MDSAGSAGVSAAGLHRRHTPNRHNGASAMNPNADDGETPNLGMGRLAVVDSRERLGRSFGRTCRAVLDQSTSSAPVRHIGAVRRLATSVRGGSGCPDGRQGSGDGLASASEASSHCSAGWFATRWCPTLLAVDSRGPLATDRGVRAGTGRTPDVSRRDRRRVEATVTAPFQVATLEATLERITYANEDSGYMVAKVDTGRGGELVTVVGSLLGARPAEALRLRGRWGSHPQYGRQFQVEDFTTVLVPG